MAALPGTHYCGEHQGNSSHYDSLNCAMCIEMQRSDSLAHDRSNRDKDIAVLKKENKKLRKMLRKMLLKVAARYVAKEEDKSNSNPKTGTQYGDLEL